ncbi:RluA family pseudouridine synthase [Pseudocolwellia agarivorans]|uniref:RluA family pseudouridine synthase n=1 Tax=Pseudocolwellia agarivorans TaxID=1911682 RepID=UPI003F881E2D
MSISKDHLADRQIFEKHIVVTSETTNALLELEAVCNISIADLKKAITKGALWLTRGKSTQRFRRIKKALKQGDELHFYYNQDVLNQIPNEAKLIEDMGEYSVWYKPYGMLSQGSKWSDHCTIARWAQTHLQPERAVFIVHRLDRAASGLIVIAHTKKMAQAFSKMFELHHLEKRYLILIHGDHRSHSQPEIITTQVDGKNAKSQFTCKSYNESLDTSLINVLIDSGRKHQIRLHAASIGMPVVGDRLHGDSKRDDLLIKKISKDIDLQLCAFSLVFVCPISLETKTFRLPDELLPSHLSQ